nr:hypothetical protein [Patulibacter sp.]
LLEVGLRVRDSPTDVDRDLVSRMLVGNAEEGARLLLQRPDEYPRERLLRFTRWLTGTIPRGAAYPVSLRERLDGLPADDPLHALIAAHAAALTGGQAPADD